MRKLLAQSSEAIGDGREWNVSFSQISEVFLGDMVVAIAEPYLLKEEIDVDSA